MKQETTESPWQVIMRSIEKDADHADTFDDDELVMPANKAVELAMRGAQLISGLSLKGLYEHVMYTYATALAMRFGWDILCIDYAHGFVEFENGTEYVREEDLRTAVDNEVPKEVLLAYLEARQDPVMSKLGKTNNLAAYLNHEKLKNSA